MEEEYICYNCEKKFKQKENQLFSICEDCYKLENEDIED